MKKILPVLIVLIIAIAIVFFLNGKRVTENQTTTSSSGQASESVLTPNSAPASNIVDGSSTVIKPPISNALSRVTKKPFGLFVTPKSSPVSPEKFSGFHTGVDFETTSSEQNIDVPIFAACDGKVLLKKWATGYGGVLVQSCHLQSGDVTVIYGHLNINSISLKIGETLKSGDKIGILGKGYSGETDGERKHLHFGIHKGTSVNILGYVQKQSDLLAWMNPQDLLK
jgi:murein DD-endopeptidase MepM/ murein hydrolase activator NlpD